MDRRPQFESDDQKWRAVLQRDSDADGRFLYAVATTGIYCRPNCSSRKPNRTNVRFFATTDAARRAGFRACKRCQPDRLEQSAELDLVAEACRLMDAAETPLTLKALGERLGVSSSHLQRTFKNATGVSPKAYAAELRSVRLRAELQRSQSVTAAIQASGFETNSRCYESSEQHLGMTPGDYRRGGLGQAIHYAILSCDLGWVLVASTERGVCAIDLGDSPETLRDQFIRRFPEANLQVDDGQFREWILEVVAHVQNPVTPLTLPLHVRGTVFQRRVWEALQQIPMGVTHTYSELADQIGQPTAARAVASACAANQLAVAIPCHRVLRSDGSLSGYRWGVERKHQLLDHERELDE